MPSLGTLEERFPELFNQASINPRSRTRKVEMKVLVIGMMRTGTMSMKTALEQLGYGEVYHMTSAMKNPKDYDMWTEAFNAKFHGKGEKFTRKDWDMLLGNAGACIDVPTAAFMPELIEAYPDAKVIVSMRDPDKWYTSLMATVGRTQSLLMIKILSFLDPFFLGRFMPFLEAMKNGMWKCEYSDAKGIKESYVNFHEEVRQIVPEDKRLEYHLGDGWEPLCKFLGKDVPKGPFPFINESAEFSERVGLIEKQAMTRILNKAVPIAGLIGVASSYYFGLLPRW
ncbi:hypothetical protein MMC13_004427 [Lambiella insularis]|nr:hypothetical protein [Lambiella insularis]